MSDEKNFNEENEEVTTSAEETAETADTAEETDAEAVVEATEAVEEAVEEAQGEFVDAQSAETALGDNTDGTDDAVSAESEEDLSAIVNGEQTVQQDAEKTKTSKGALIAVIAAAVLVVALIVVGLVVYGPSLFNKYNRMGYIDTSGRTVEEVAEAMNMEYSEFLEMYGLPEDMPKNTTESAAYNNIPISNMAKTYGMSTEDFKGILQLGDDVTDDTTWGEAINKATLGAYVGEEYLPEFKEYYGLGDDVTVDTLWGDIRQTVEKKQREERIEREKEEAKATKIPEADEAATEAPAEGEAAEATEAPAADAAEAPAA